MKRFNWLILTNLLALLMYYNYSIFDKETILKDGTLVLLQLAPVDPRSLMQGDYMQLRYDIAERSDTLPISKRGYIVISLDSNNVAHKLRLQAEQTPLHTDELLLKYTTSDPLYGNIRLGAESYFFQEGNASHYGTAKYGGLRIDNEGNSILVGLYKEGFTICE
jgi:uncharacterized membrane-anchored protein